jgi:hypothetical protein
MSMMMPPDYAPGLPTPPGGGDALMGGDAPPQDMLNGSPIPGQGGMDGLLAALGGGGGDPNAPPDAGADPDQGADLDSIGHIREAMKHLMMAMAKDEDESRGHGITKGMGALQAVLAGHQKEQQQLSGPTGGPPSGPPGV